MYTRADDLGWKQSNAFKKTFSIDVDIEFLGVWSVLMLFPPIHPFPHVSKLPSGILSTQLDSYQGFYHSQLLIA